MPAYPTMEVSQKIARKQKSKSISSLFLTIVVSFFVITTPSGATFSPVDHSVSDSGETALQQQAGIHPQTSKTRLPESSTMALFSGGLLGMILDFVRRTYKALKRGIDVVLSIIVMIVLSPLFLITAILVKLTSPGPVFYVQERMGKDNVPFNMIKFRTMKDNAEKATGSVWARKNDPRLTPVGSFLRNVHIDEIPQFINVLRGEMSVVGPRPERPVFVEKLKTQIPDYEKRLTIKPGITGLAQVYHRYDETIVDVKKKIKYDLLYIKKICFWTDVIILLKTFRVVITGEGAR